MDIKSSKMLITQFVLFLRHQHEDESVMTFNAIEAAFALRVETMFLVGGPHFLFYDFSCTFLHAFTDWLVCATTHSHFREKKYFQSDNNNHNSFKIVKQPNEPRSSSVTSFEYDTFPWIFIPVIIQPGY